MERTVRGRSGRPGRDLTVPARQQIPVPAQHRVRPDQQPEPAKHIAREPVQQGGQERPVGGGEPRPGRARLPLQHRDLVAQRQDLDILVPVAHREKPQ
jgi:hypothetical protein